MVVQVVCREFVSMLYPKASLLPRVLLLLILVAIKLPFYGTYRPLICGDTPGYAVPAYNLTLGDWNYYDGGRTPGYPLFLATVEFLTDGTVTPLLSARSAFAVVVLQNMMGVAVAFLIYGILRRITGTEWLSYAGALLYGLYPGTTWLEFAVLTETLATFLLTLCFYLLLRVLKEPLTRNRQYLLAAILGALFAADVLVRPALILFPSLLLVILAARCCFERKNTQAQRLSFLGLALSCTIFLSMIFAWETINYFNTGYFCMTNLLGLSREQVIFNAWEDAAPQDKVAGDILAKYLHKYPAGSRSQRQFIWAALPELDAHLSEMPIKLRKGFPWQHAINISHYLDGASGRLILRRPDLYAGNVEKNLGLVLTFDVMNIPKGSGDPIGPAGKESVKSRSLQNRILSLWFIYEWILYVVAIVFLLASLFLILFFFGSIRRRLKIILSSLDSIYLASIIISFWSYAGISCLTTAYDPRYTLPALPLIIVSSLSFLWLASHAVSDHFKNAGRFPAKLGS